ncbi:MAG: stage III sporulation protein AF [Lachnospiraceae bacterium]|nr:stage III sporulation protein AF [Lachnospiraceae bacterium]
MAELYGWVRNIIVFFLFLTILDNLVPKKSYQKYIRLFAGMVTILLILGPVTGGLGLEERIAHYYETLMFQYEAEELHKEILGMEQQRLGEMIGQYEKAVEEDIRQMAEDTGFMVYDCQVEISREEGDERFGSVVGIWIKVGLEKRTEREEAVRGKAVEVEIKETIEPVVVEGDREEERSGEIARENRRRQQEAEYGAIGKLRRKIGAYYGLEEAYVEIQVIEGKG